MRESLQKVRALKGKMTRDAQGRQFIESDPFEAAVHQLDEQGLTGSADELLCDALLVHPSSKYRYLLGRRLARRGRLDEANALLAQLTEHPQWANAALKLLAQIAEREHRPEDAELFGARACLELPRQPDPRTTQTIATAKRIAQRAEAQILFLPHWFGAPKLLRKRLPR